jgi:hypothetical protein
VGEERAPPEPVSMELPAAAAASLADAEPPLVAPSMLLCET